MPHTFVSLRYHLVFSTRGRLPLIKPNIREELYRYIGGIIRKYQGLLLEIGGIEDHVHILASFRPRIAVSEMLKHLKGSSSSWLNKRRLCDQTFAWQTCYAAFTVSESQIGSVRRYIRRQPQHHRKMSYREEIEALLKRHGIDYSKDDL